MAASKKFFEAVSKDAALRAEVEKATLEALNELLKSKGLEAYAAKAAEAAMTKVAEAHGFAAEAMAEVSEDEMKAVAGGVCGCGLIGSGSGTGKNCACFVGGIGKNNSGEDCPCGCVK